MVAARSHGGIYSGLSACTGKRLIGHQKKVHSIMFSPDGHQLGSASVDHTIRIWDVENLSSSSSSTLSTSVELRDHTAAVETLTWDPSQPKRLASASSDKTVRLWDLRTSKASKTVRTEGENINLAWSPDGLYLAVGNRDEVLSFIDARKGTVLKTIRCPTEVNEVKWSPSGSLFFLTLGSGKVDILQWPNMHRVKRIYGHMDRCYCIDFDPSSPRFAVGGADALVTLWDLDELYCIRTFERCEWPVRTLSFSHDGVLLASASEDLFIDIACTETGALVYKLPVKTATNSINFHPSKTLLAYAGEDNSSEVAVHIYGFPSHVSSKHRSQS